MGWFYASVRGEVQGKIGYSELPIRSLGVDEKEGWAHGHFSQIF
jgi:hypothetical protein